MPTYTPRELTAMALALTAYTPDQTLAVSSETAIRLGYPAADLAGIAEVETTASELAALCILALRIVGEVPADAGI